MRFRKKNQGSVLIYVMIISVAMGIALTSMLSASGMEGLNIQREQREIGMYFAANSGHEVLRGMLYYDNRATFSQYLGQKARLEAKVLNWNTYNITFSIDNNNIDDGWGGTSYDGDGILAIHSTAHKNAAFTSEGLQISSQIMLQMTTKYSFANNTWANAYIMGIQHWFGDV
ncbi:MAG: hypothetical protein K8S87_09390, partial [Planctomycetes bacterium]|nr:hypothetical protein [Planctomycetota bacterium]